MRSTCAHPDCGGAIVSNVTGEHWYHVSTPWPPHEAWTDREPEHTCRRLDPDCPLCDLAGAIRPAERPRSSLDYSFVHKTKASEAYRVDGKRTGVSRTFHPPTL